MKIYNKKREHIKTVPARYESVKNLIDFFKSPEKRLTREERFEIELHLFKVSLKPQLHLYNEIKDLKVISAVEVTLRGVHYTQYRVRFANIYRVGFANIYSVICPFELFKAWHGKKEVLNEI